MELLLTYEELWLTYVELLLMYEELWLMYKKLWLMLARKLGYCNRRMRSSLRCVQGRSSSLRGHRRLLVAEERLLPPLGH